MMNISSGMQLRVSTINFLHLPIQQHYQHEDDSGKQHLTDK